jgi:broad specificity phosphatase PhoE
MRRTLVALIITVSASRLLAAPAQVIIIRHAEKPANGNELSLRGRERAAALAVYFLGNTDVLEFGPPKAIYAQSQRRSTSSRRSIQTVKPLADALHLKVEDHVDRDAFELMIDEIKHKKEYEGHTVLICWEHKVIPEIAKALGAKDAPESWAGDIYDRTWVLTFKADHSCKFRDLPQQLMFGDSKK